jgi:L-histidine N-alpha-methyltransferase
MELLTIDVHLEPADLAAALCADVVDGLTASPKELPPKWFYDERGSELFEQITDLDVYYPTRREREILETRAADIAALTRADTLIELGSGTSKKTRLLLDALRDGGTLRRFVPFDVSEPTLRAAAAAIVEEYAGVSVHAVVGDFERHLTTLPGGGRRVVAFLGGTIGNLQPAQREKFFTELRGTMTRDDSFLLGADLVKDPARLVAAYDDALGVTAEFNKNVLAVINRQLGADFQLDAFVHEARWDAEREWIEMALISTRDQPVWIANLDLTVDFGVGERMRTEISAKFRPDGLGTELAATGFALEELWTDSAGDFALCLARPA